jgi:hypothetical protein
MIFDSFSDIIKHTHSLGLVDMVKIDGTADSADIQAMDTTNKSVVIYGSLHVPITDLDSTIGLARISVLDGYLKFPAFADKKATVSIVKQERGGNLVPSEVSFNSGEGHTANYRFMTADVANEQIKVPPFRGAEFQVDFVPTKQGINDLTKLSSILGSFESTFTVKTENNNLVFLIGSGASDRTSLVFANNIEGTLTRAWSFPVAPVLSILKLYDTSKSVKMYFSNNAALKIEVESNIGKYTYILPAKTN